MLLKSIASASLFACSVLAAPAPLEKRADQSFSFFPWLLVPIKEAQPDQAFGTQYTVDIHYEPGKANRVDTLVSFTNSIPADKNHKCSLQFNLAKEAPSSWTISGSLKFEIVELGGPVDVSNTYNKSPSYGKVVGTVSIDKIGGSGVVSAPIDCKYGRVDYALRKSGWDAVDFHWFEMKTPTVGLTYVVN